MITITFEKAASQVSERTRRPYTKNVRYNEVDTNFFGSWFPPKTLIEQACDGVIPDVVSMTVSHA